MKITEKVVTGFFHPYVYLNGDVIQKYNLDINKVSRTLAHELQHQEGIAFAVDNMKLNN